MKTLNVFVLLFSITLFSQSTPEDVLEFSVASPQAFEFTKYASSPISEYTGRASATIPLYTYKAGALSLPIYMNYIGNGVKINQASTWTGVNWTLSAGGVITRNMKDVPDEMAFDRFFEEDVDAWDGTIGDGINYVNGDAEMVQIHSMYEVPGMYTYDTQADIFNYNFAGYSGSFYLDKECDFSVDCLGVNTKEDSELKIVFIKDSPNSQIEITTPDGVQYFFGGVGASERSVVTQMLSRGTFEQNGFYLNEIRHPLGDVILFEYTSSSYNYFISQDKEFVKVESVNLNLSDEQWCLGEWDSCVDLSESLRTTNITNTINKIYDSRFISRIYSPYNNLEINFTRSSTGPGDLYLTMPTQLDRIDVDYVDNNGAIIDDITYFNFNYINDTNRFFLEHITFNSSATGAPITGRGRQSKKYTFEYDSPLLLPDRFSYAQDYLGYYNGKTSNTTSIPKVDGYVMDYMGNLLADREADFNFATYGALTKIYYPTGGFTEFEYEPPRDLIDELQEFTFNLWDNNPNGGPECEKVNDFVYLGVPYMGPSGPTQDDILFDQTVTLNYSLIATQGTFQHHDEILFEVFDASNLNNLILLFSTYRVMPQDGTEYYGSIDFDLLAGEPYKIAMTFSSLSNTTFYPNVCNEDSDKIEISGNFKVRIGDIPIDAPGLRVKRKIDDSNSGSPIIKRYYYNAADKITEFETGTKKFIPQYVFRSPFIDCCHVYTYNGSFCETSLMNVRTNVYNLIKIRSSNYTGIFPNTDGQFTYRTVTISYGGDDFEGGGVQKSFKEDGNIVVNDYLGENICNAYNITNPAGFYNGLSNSGMFDGTLLSELTIKKENNLLYKQRLSNYNYTITNGTSVVNTVGHKLFEDCMFGFTSVDNLYIGTYTTFSKKVSSLTVTDTEYLDLLPIGTIDDGSYKKMVTTQTTTYGDLAGLATQVSFTDSYGNETLTKNYYSTPQDIAILSPPISNDDLNRYSELYAAHRVSSPIQTENYLVENGIEDKLSTTRITYDKFDGKTLVKYASTFKANDNVFDDKVEYLTYDGFGRPREFKRPDGSTTVISWFGNGEVKRIIKNCTLAEYSAAIQNADTNDNLPDNSNNCVTPNTLDLRDDLPDSEITDYFYNHYVGICTIVDPRGDLISYEYDDYNRVILVRDKDGKILNENDYNYTNQY